MSTRKVWKTDEQGKLAPIHQQWHKFTEECQINHKASPYVTKDELLLAFRG